MTIKYLGYFHHLDLYLLFLGFKQLLSSCRILSGKAVIFAYKADLIKSFPHSVGPPCTLAWTPCRCRGGRSWFCWFLRWKKGIRIKVQVDFTIASWVSRTLGILLTLSVRNKDYKEWSSFVVTLILNGEFDFFPSKLCFILAEKRHFRPRLVRFYLEGGEEAMLT